MVTKLFRNDFQKMVNFNFDDNSAKFVFKTHTKIRDNFTACSNYYTKKI